MADLPVTPPRTTVPAALRLRRAGTLRARAVQGDEAAFAVLYERHHQALFRYCRSIVRDEEDARDVLQSAMAKAYAALPGAGPDVELRPWLFRIVHNEAVSLLRRRRTSVPLDEQHASGEADLAATADDRARLAQLRIDLDDLGERRRAALVLRELSGLGHEEIAGVLDTTPGAVKQTIFEARRALAEMADGRAMACDAVCAAVSDGDGRTLRGRRMRAHLRSCRSCTAFAAAIEQRRGDLALLAPPLAAPAAAAVLAQVVGGAASGGAGVAGGTAAGVAAGGAAAGLAAKAVAVVGVTAALAGGTVAVRAGGGEQDAPARGAATAETVPPRAATMPSAPARPVVARTPAVTAPAARRPAPTTTATPAAAASPGRSAQAPGRSAQPVAAPARPAKPAVPGRSATPSRPSRRPVGAKGKPATTPSSARRPEKAAPVPARGGRPATPPPAAQRKPVTAERAAPATGVLPEQASADGPRREK